MFKGIANLAGLMRQAKLVGGQMQELQDKLEHQRVSGAAGGGLVEVEANGKGQVVRVRLDEQLVAKADREMLEDLLPAAINQALEKARQLQMEEMQSVVGGLDVPGLSEALAEFNPDRPE